MDGVQVGTVVAGRYKIVEAIGQGGMGAVYRVEHVHTGEPLALKVMLGHARFDPQALSRFKREARASARIASEHVVRVTDADTAPELDNSPFIVMELLRGSDLEKLARARGGLDRHTVVTLLAQVGRALEAAHKLGIVHRDIKPENLFLCERADGTTVTKVLDFGISKFVSAEAALETANMTSTGSVIGTPLYMAPEQAHGQNDKIDASTDIWAIGLVAMRLLMGESYWGAPTMADLMMKLAVKPIIPPSQRWPERKDITPELDEWFLRSCDRDQSKRWPSISVQVRELAEALGVDLEDARTKSLPSALVAVPPASQSPLSATEENRIAMASTADSANEARAVVDEDGIDDVRAKDSRSIAESVSGSTALTRSRDVKPPPSSRWPLVALAAAALTAVVVIARSGGSTEGQAKSTEAPLSTAAASPQPSAETPSPVASVAIPPTTSLALLPSSAAPATSEGAPTPKTSAPSAKPTSARPRPASSASAAPSAAATASSERYSPVAP